MKVLHKNDEEKMLEILKPLLNTEASNSNKYGIVHYPK